MGVGVGVGAVFVACLFVRSLIVVVVVVVDCCC